MKIKEILLKVEAIERESNAYFYSFRSNLKEYFVFLEERDNLHKLFCYSDFRFVEPIELLTTFWVNDNGIELTGTKEIQMHVIDILEPTTFNRALGQYLHLKKLENVGDLEKYVNVYFARQFLDLIVLSERFFITKEGLSIFTYPQETKYIKGAIPNGMLFFNNLNCGYVGNPILRIDRKNRPEKDDTLKEILGNNFKETAHIIFSPFTLLELYSNGLSHFKNNFLIIADAQQKNFIYRENIKIHLRPTLHELSNYIELVYSQWQEHTITTQQTFPTYFSKDNNNNFKIILHVENYAKEYNRFVDRLNLFSNLLSVHAKDDLVAPPAINHFNLALIKKGVELIDNYDFQEHTLDLVEFTFQCTPANCLAFIHEYIFRKMPTLKTITTIHFNVGFPLMLEETLEEFLGIENITAEDIEYGLDEIFAQQHKEATQKAYYSEDEAIEAMLEQEE